MENNAESRKQILSMYEGLQPLEGYEFKPWSDEQRERVFKFVSDLTGSNPGNAYANTTNYAKPQKPDHTPTPTTPYVAPKTEVDSRIDAFENAGKSSATAADNDIEDWLKEFDIK